MSYTLHPDVPLGRHIQIGNHHYVISRLAWDTRRVRAYAADEMGRAVCGHPVLAADGGDPEAVIEQLLQGTG